MAKLPGSRKGAIHARNLRASVVVAFNVMCKQQAIPTNRAIELLMQYAIKKELRFAVLRNSEE